MKNSYNEIIIPILGIDFKAIFTWGTEEQVKQVLVKYLYPIDSVEMLHFKDNRGTCFWYHDCHPIMAMPNLPETTEDIATVAHEAVHAVDHIFEMIDEDGCGEVFAHSVSTIVEIVLNEVARIKEEEKKAKKGKK